jgi:hypothetical protein
MQSPKKEVSADAHKAYRETRINLEALYDAADPFSTPLGSQGGEVEDGRYSGGQSVSAEILAYAATTGRMTRRRSGFLRSMQEAGAGRV